MSKYKWTAGQKVFEPARGWGGFPGRVLTIDRVTPSGRAVTADGSQYRPDGGKIGGKYLGGIVPFTEQHQAELDLWDIRCEAGKLLDGLKLRELSQDHAEKLVSVLRSISESSDA